MTTGSREPASGGGGGVWTPTLSSPLLSCSLFPLNVICGILGAVLSDLLFLWLVYKLHLCTHRTYLQGRGRGTGGEVIFRLCVGVEGARQSLKSSE